MGLSHAIARQTLAIFLVYIATTVQNVLKSPCFSIHIKLTFSETTYVNLLYHESIYCQLYISYFISKHFVIISAIGKYKCGPLRIVWDHTDINLKAFDSKSY